MSTALVPLQRVRFGGGREWPSPDYVLAVEPLPRDTLDPRYRYCVAHHTACVCREAELAERIAEQQHELNALRSAALDVLVGHRLFDWGDDNAAPVAETLRLMRGDGPLACQCTGCRLMRRADIGGLVLRTDNHGVVQPRSTS